MIVAPALLAAALAAADPAAPHASHVTLVVMENRSAAGIAGNRSAPYFNGVLRARGLLLTNAHAVTHPSEPNYLALFSGSTQGLTSDRCPVSYDAPNLASELAAAGKSFAGYAESMPANGFTGCWAASYARKHVPWADFSNVPARDSRVYRGWPAVAPSVAWIVPNLCHDMHDCSTAAGDAWMAANLPRIVAWDELHDGLLIVTWDEAEPDDGTNRIATLLIGPTVRPGRSAQRVDHYGVLRTIETIFGLPCIDRECRAAPITGVWR
ncbi:MAG TPA: alkaline phosphatase family protein [Candidatus Tumulicola sp.]|nr:alkaline phosphatase family protein [Candidatus Tumulicola sp.]